VNKTNNDKDDIIDDGAVYIIMARQTKWINHDIRDFWKYFIDCIWWLLLFCAEKWNHCTTKTNACDTHDLTKNGSCLYNTVKYEYIFRVQIQISKNWITIRSSCRRKFKWIIILIFFLSKYMYIYMVVIWY